MGEAIVEIMANTTMQLDRELRDELAAIAARDYDGVSLAEALRRLVMEHRFAQIMTRYEQLRADPDEWASYQAELRLTDNVAGEGLSNARDEYPEYNT